jgi:Undecaprenyl-phosphate glucose phosphotransferase
MSYSSRSGEPLSGDSARITWSIPTSDLSQRLSVFVLKLLAAEFIAIAASAYVATVAYHFAVWNQGPPFQKYIAASLGLAALILVVSLSFRHYEDIQVQPPHKFLLSGVQTLLVSFSLFVSIIFLVKIGADYSRGTFLFQFIGVGAAVLSVRALALSKLRSAISLGHVKARRVVLIGNSRVVRQFATRLSSAGVQTVRSFDYPFRTAETSSSAGLPAPKAIDEIVANTRELRLDDVFIIANHEDLPTLAILTNALSVLPVGVHIILMDWLDLLATPRIAEFGNVTTIQVAHPPLTPLDCALKRAFDVALAAVGLVMLSPLLAIISLAIKLDSPGPVLFRQTRHGYNNEGIEVFKFRTMRLMEPGHGFVQAVKNDSRVTNIGRILRRSSIDELPQLFNVLCGNMSIVGPRPHATLHNEMFEALIPPLSRRHKVKPGITGWAQVNGSRGETDTLEKMQRRVELDLYYIDNWSFLLDCKIVLLTLFSRKVHANVY